MTKIILYQYETCPFCAKVRNKLEKLKLEHKIVNVSPDHNEPLRKEVIEKSGISTVPVIKIGNLYMGESGEILTYLEKNFSS